MITKHGYGSMFNHEPVLSHLRNIGAKTVLDVGASKDLWAREFVTAVVDICDPAENKIWFQGNMSLPWVWTNVQEHVKVHGKFDFAICTHTLEDIGNPKMVCDLLGSVAKEGYIAIPSKFMECQRHEGKYRGWVHHRWIFDYDDGFIGYPSFPM